MSNPIDCNDAHVLVIDDEEFMRQMTRRVLNKIGVNKISEASDGADGLTKMAIDPPDIIVLDIMMEPMNGLKFLKTVRTGLMGGRPDMPVIVLTGSSEQAVFGTAMALDCNAFVRKDKDMNLIEDRMVRVLGEVQEIKPSDNYMSIEIPDITIIVPQSQSQQASPHTASIPPTKEFEIAIEEVEVGALVARDVLSESGELILASGSVLSAAYLNRLKDISEIIDLPSLWIEK